MRMEIMLPQTPAREGMMNLYDHILDAFKSTTKPFPSRSLDIVVGDLTVNDILPIEQRLLEANLMVQHLIDTVAIQMGRYVVRMRSREIKGEARKLRAKWEREPIKDITVHSDQMVDELKKLLPWTSTAI